MPRYQKGTAGKLIVQDWQVLETYDSVNVLRYVTPRQAAALIALAEFLAWSTRYTNPPGQDALDAFEAETRYNLMTPVDFCALMINCIVNDTDVQDALTAWLIQSIQNNIDVQNALNQVYKETDHNVPIPPGRMTENLLPANPGCNLDVLFGQIVSLVENMNTNNTDAFEAFEELTDVTERAVLLMGAIPVVETLPIDEIVDYAQQIWTDDLFDAYIANDTTGYRDEIKCDLFCIARANGCQLTMNDMKLYFAQRVGASPEDAVAEAIAYMVAGTWTGTEVNDLFYWVQTSMMIFGNKYFDIVGLKPFGVYLKLGDPDSDWMILCDDCGTCVYFPFDVAPYDWEIINGSYAIGPFTGEYCYLSEVVGDEVFVTIKYTFPGPTRIERTEVLSTHPDMYVSITTDDGDICIEEYHPAMGAEWIIHNAPVIEAASWIQISFRREVPDGELELNAVKIYYVGDPIVDGVECA